MMKGLDAIYDEAFFREWGPANKAYVDMAEDITGEIYRRLRPARVADLGCGCGVYGHFFRRLGAEVFSLDGVLPPAEHSFGLPVHRQDLTAPFENVWGRFDLTLCLEVAEHIPGELSGVFLENLARFGDTLLLSAAPPNQGGVHHVNEQPKRYWVRRLAELGFAYNRPRTGDILEALKARRRPNMWMFQHLSVYERARGGGEGFPALPFSVKLGGIPGGRS
jgi:SAM-dependent methyltransferase